MAQILPEVSRTFNEFLLLPNRTSAGCSPETIDLSVALARNWQRYDLTENLAMTTAKIRATMASWGARNLAEFRATARLVEVSEQTYQENTASVTIRESMGAITD